ncbi:diguanylate cyclase [Thermatribacter velox]|uniref:Diguanylate cyclase n=1 Tax=Thermatribacter velox TaxID=3039681 RepID=A0ABZ2YBD1_9BACT
MRVKFPLLRFVLFFVLGFSLAFALFSLFERRIASERLHASAQTFANFVKHEAEHWSVRYFQNVLLYTALAKDIVWLNERELTAFKKSNPEILDAFVVEANAGEIFPNAYRIQAREGLLRVHFLVFDAEGQDFVKDRVVEAVIDPQLVLHRLGMEETVKIVPQGGKPFAFGLRAAYSGLERGLYGIWRWLISLFAGAVFAFWSLFSSYRKELDIERKLREEYEREIRALRMMNEFLQAVLRPGYNLSYAEILEKAVALIPHAQGGTVLGRRGDFLVFEAALGHPLEALQAFRFELKKVEAHPECAVIVQGEPVVLADLKKLFALCLSDEAERALLDKLRFERVRCVLSVAINVSGELRAVLSVDNLEREEAFSPSEVELLRLFAGQVSALWERRNFEERLSLQAQELDRKSRILAEMLNFIKALLNPDHRFDYAHILRKAVELVPGAQRGSLLLKEGKVFVFRAAVGYDLEKLAQVALTEEELSREMTPEVKVVRNLDELNRSRLSKEKLELLTESGGDGTIRATLSVPLVLEGEIVGFFNLDNLEDPEAFGPGEIEIAQLFADQISVILERLRLEEKLEEQKRLLEHLSCHDPLTDLLNKRAFQEMAGKVLALARREKKPAFVLYLDLQGFKEVNDRFGHEAGDTALKVIAERLQKNLRENDVLARIGGDEFVIVLYGIDRGSVSTIVERIVASIREPLEWQGNNLTVSANVGIAVYPEDGESLEKLLRRADFAMYRAKKKGLPFAFFEDGAQGEDEEL